MDKTGTKVSYLNTFTLPQNFQINSLSCRSFSNNPTCVFLNKQNLFGHMRFAFNNDKLTVTSQNSYPYYNDFIPDNWSFNEEFLVTRARNSTTEIMMIYKLFGNSKVIEQTGNTWWGLTTQDYYNNITEVSSTKSIPLIFKQENGVTAIRFTQNMIFGQFQGDNSVLKAFSANGGKLEIKSELKTDDAKSIMINFLNDKLQFVNNITLEDLFSGSGSSYGKISVVVWILISIVIVGLIAIVLVRSGGGGEKYEDEEAPQDSYYAEGDYTELDKEEDNKVAITEDKMKRARI